MSELKFIPPNLYPSETIEEMEALIEATRAAIRGTRFRSAIAMHQRDLEYMKSALQRKRAAMTVLHDAIKKQEAK